MVAPAFSYIERELASAVAARTGQLCLREEFSNMVEHPGIGCHIRARTAANRLLVDANQPRNFVGTGNDSSGSLIRRGAFEEIQIFFVAFELMAQMIRDEFH